MPERLPARISRRRRATVGQPSFMSGTVALVTPPTAPSAHSERAPQPTSRPFMRGRAERASLVRQVVPRRQAGHPCAGQGMGRAGRKGRLAHATRTAAGRRTHRDASGPANARLGRVPPRGAGEARAKRGGPRRRAHLPRAGARVARVSRAREGSEAIDAGRLPLDAGRAGRPTSAARASAPARSWLRWAIGWSRQSLRARSRSSLRGLDKSGSKPRMVNRYRQLISAVWNYGMREDAYELTHNPAAGTSKRREPPKAVLDFYEPEEVELLAETAERGLTEHPRTVTSATRSSWRGQPRTGRTRTFTASPPTRGCARASCSRFGGRMPISKTGGSSCTGRSAPASRDRRRAGRRASSRSPTAPRALLRTCGSATSSSSLATTSSARGSVGRWTPP